MNIKTYINNLKQASMVVDNVKQATTTTAYANAIKGLNLEQAKLALSTKQLSSVEKEEILVKAGLLNATGQLTTGQLTAILTTKQRNAEDAKALLLSTELISAETAEATATNIIETAKLKELVATKQLTVAEAELIAMKAKVTTANIKEASTTITSVGKTSGAISILGQSIGSTLSKIGNGLLSFASAHPMITALTATVGLVGLVNSEIKKYQEEQEELIENAKVLQEEYRSFTKSTSDNINSLKGQEDEFECLSKGVSEFGENISLSADEYDRYKSIVAEVLGYTPELISGYDAEGTAIANKNSLLERSIELMKEEQRQKLKELTSDENTETAYDAAKAEWDKNKAYDGATTRNEIARWFDNNSTSSGFRYEGDIAKILGVYDEYKDEGYDLYLAIIDDIGTASKNIKEKKDELLALTDARGKSVFTREEIDNMVDLANEWQKSYNDWQESIEESKHGMDDQFNLFAQRADGYDDLNNAQKAFVDGYIKATGEIVDAEGNLLSKDDILDKAKDYEKFVDKLATDPDYDSVKKKIDELYSIDFSDISLTEVSEAISKYVDEIAKILEINPLELKIALGFEDEITLLNNYQSVIDSASRKAVGVEGANVMTADQYAKYTEIYDKIDEFAQEQSINTQDEIAAFNKALEDANYDIDKAFENYLAQKSKGNEITVLGSISETVEHLDKKVKPVMDSLKSAYQDIFTEDGFTLDNVSVDMLNSVKESIAEINEIEGVDIATSTFEDFTRVLTDTETTEKQAHEAFNNLVTSIINGTDSTFVSSDAFNTLVQSLEEMGVTNADEALNEIKTVQDHLIKQGIDIDNITADEAEGFLKEAEALGISTQWFKTYTLQKAIAENPLDTTEDIKALENLCNVLGVTGEMLEYVNSIKYANQMIELREKTGMGAPVEAYEATIENAKKNIQRLLDEGSVFEFDFKFDGSKDGLSKSSNSSSTFDWVDTQISDMEDSLSKLDTQVSNTYSKWDARNQKLAESIAKTNEAITLQENAANAYMNEANSVGLDNHYKTLVQKGALDAKDVVDKDLADKISEYQDLYEKSVQCTEKANELRRTMKELETSEAWDLFKTESDADIELFDKQIDSYQTALDKLELKGMFANESYYNDMVDLTQSKIATLRSQYTELQSIIAKVTPDSEVHDSMSAELQDIQNQIAELENECIEFNNNVRNLDWDIFEFFEESVSRVSEEINFLKDLLSDEDMFDDNGNMTKYADATMGLHFANIEVYKKQAQDYYEEMQELQEQLNNGAGDEVLQQYREYEDAHRDAISSIRDEQNAILDLVNNAYEEQISALERINDLTLERMDRERDLYNYQKNIAEKTKEKTSLERQIDVYSDSDSEESVAKVQQLKLELEKVNSDIEDMEYEQQRADTEAMLTKLTDDFKLWQSQRLDNEAGLLENIRSEVESKSNEIQATLKEVAGQYGTTLSTSLTSIFGSEKPFDSVVTAINDLIAKISGIVGVDETSNNGSDGGSNGGSNSLTNEPTPQVKSDTANQNTQSDTKSKAEADDIFIPLKSVYPKDKLDKEHSIVDALKFYDYDSSYQARAKYYKALVGSDTFTGSDTQNTKLLKKFRQIKGYASGTRYAKQGMHWTQEDGEELIIRTTDGAILTPLKWGDKVVNAEGTNNLYDFANDPQGFLEKFGVMNYTMPAVNVKVPDVSALKRNNTSPCVNLGGVHIAQVVTNDAQDFMKQLPFVIANDTKTQKVISEVVLGGALGHNSMNARRLV